jgi:tetratricopeptide (TPR) repeat protein
VTRVDSWSVSAVREAIAQVPDTTPVRRILSSIVDVMVSATAIDMHALTPRLMAYGQTLEYESRWPLAADVYQTIISHAHPVDDSDLAIAAHLQLAFCLRTLGDLDHAARTYDMASNIAYAAGDLMGVLRARLGDAKIAASRGNMPRAESILEETISRAATGGFDDIRSRALTDRAYVASARGQVDRAVAFSYEALALTQSPRTRDRILNNIATGFRDLGLLDAARDSYVVLAATAEEQYIRWNAEVNLMELVAQQGIELQFDRYRRELESADFTPDLRVTYLLYVGRGYHALGRSESGIPYLERAIDMASQYSLNHLAFEAEAALANAKRDSRPNAPKAKSVSDEIRHVVDGIHGMRELVGSR